MSLSAEAGLYKLNKLNKILASLRSVVVAYSGGVDSTFLLKAAIDALGKRNVLAVTARSETYPASEYKEAVVFARDMGAKHMTIDTNELANPKFRSNPVNRCYYCKKELFTKLDGIRKRRGMASVIDGTNYDDLKDIRYGRKASAELGVRSPLLESKITKDDIRKLSRKLRLPTWDKPSFACLASRIPFDNEITIKDLARIDAAESCLRGMGFRQNRVRSHGNIARIEVSKTDLAKAVKLADKITTNMNRLGYVYATLDLAGYRTGSMHDGAIK